MPTESAIFFAFYETLSTLLKATGLKQVLKQLGQEKEEIGLNAPGRDFFFWHFFLLIREPTRGGRGGVCMLGERGI